MNTRLFQRVADDILAAPKFFQMPSLARPLYDNKGEICGTACCIAGDTVRLCGAKLKYDRDRNEVIFFPTKRIEKRVNRSSSYYRLFDPSTGKDDTRVIDGFWAAIELLDITEDQANRLFYSFNWPTKFRNAYNNAKTARGRARAGYNRIQHFIKTKGEE